MIDTDAVRIYIEDHILPIIIITATILVFLLGLFFFLMFRSSEKKEREKVLLKKQEEMKILPESLYLPQDPLTIPGFQLYFEKKDLWTEEDVKTWYIDPTPEALNSLQDLSDTLVDSILESVP